jgi:hypothetical protein
MAKYSMKKGGKEVGPASVYAEPHTMTGKKVSATNVLKDESGAEYVKKMRVSVGNISKGSYAEPKTSGIKIRGTGAATKGTMARGPMA